MYFNTRLWEFTAGFRLRILLGIFFGVLTAVAGVSRLVMSGYVVALVFQGEPFNKVAVSILGVVLAIISRSIFQYFKEMTGHRTALKIQQKLRRRLFAKTIELGPAVLLRRRTGDLLLSLVEGVEVLESYFGEYLPQMFVGLITPIGLFCFMAFLDIYTALIYLSFALITLVAPLAFHRWNEKSSLFRRDAYHDLSAEFLDSVQGLATLKSFGQSDAKGDDLAAKARRVFRSTMAILATNQATIGVTWLGISGGAALALGLGALRVSSGELDLSTLLIVVMLGVEVFRPLRELTLLYHHGMIGMASAKSVLEIIDAEPLVSDNSDVVRHDGFLDSTLTFHDVSFSYPGREGVVLDDMSFSVLTGERLAIVGPSGAGKTTIVSLVMRFFDPDSGAVRIGSRDLRDIPLDFAREHISVVSQDTYIFFGTVAENLRYGKLDATDEELQEAADAANALEFIKALPQGFDTLLGERGIKLSGGQKQRIAIARALLKDAPILILDEALSSVDAENEFLIQKALDKLMINRTTLIIAHRLSSVIGADRILVIDQGQVVQEGSHDELISTKGIYFNLMMDQLEADESKVKTARSEVMERIDSPKKNLRGAGLPPATIKKSNIQLKEVFARLLNLIRPWRTELILTFLLGIGRVSVLLGLGIVSAFLVAEVANGNAIFALLVSLGVLAVLTPVFQWAESWIAHDLAFRLLAEMRIDLYKKLDKLAPAYLVRHRSGDIVSAVTTDVETVELFFAHTIAPAFVAIAVPLSVLLIIGSIEWLLALILMPIIILIAYMPFRVRDKLDLLGFESREQLGEVNAHMVDGIQGIREIVSFGRSSLRLEEVDRNQSKYASLRIKFFHILTVQRALIESAMGLGGILVLGLGAYLVTIGDLSVSFLPLVSIIAYTAFIPVSEVAQVGRQLSDTIGSARRIFRIHDEPVTILDGPRTLSSENKTSKSLNRGELEFKDVTFTYMSEMGPVLQDVNFVLNPGQNLALIGRSGAGKTTAAHLVLRFWDPQTGAISLDDVDIRTYRLNDLRDQIALVSQDTYLFNTSIKENLMMARPNASESDVIQAAKSASAHEFIMDLPDRYNTVAGERGFQLSGGQRQRIAIARAFLKNAPILILDEATSHLDAESESLIHQSLDTLMSGRSTIIIAHRLSTIKSADNIIVLDGGKVVEQGTHDVLLSDTGLYASLVSKQTQRTTRPSI